MRTTSDIIYDYERVNVDHKDYLLTFRDCERAMKEAQVEALKEIVKRKNSEFYQIVLSGTARVRSIDDIALELIKEIEAI